MSEHAAELGGVAEEPEQTNLREIDPHVSVSEDSASAVATEAASDLGASAFPESEDALPSETTSVEGAASTLTCVRCVEFEDALKRKAAEFANYRRVMGERLRKAESQGASMLVSKLLDALDAIEAGLKHHREEISPLHEKLIGTLTAEGLSVITPTDEEFNPAFHEAVFHTPDDGVEVQKVVEVIRTGYVYKGKVLRPALVSVVG